MSVTNIALAYNLGLEGYCIYDGVIPTGTTQATALRITAQATRTVGGATNSGLILPSILSGEAPGIVWVLNDGPNAIKVYTAAGENHNGGSNAFLSIAAGAAAVFMPVFNSKGGTIDWRSAVLT